MARLLRVVSQPWSGSRAGDEVLAAFGGPYSSVSARLGFANASGVRHIADALEKWSKAGNKSRFVVGVDGTVTSEAGARALLRLADELWLFRHPGRPLFHPKTYLFESASEARVLIGSANLTESALWVNYEDTAVLDFDLTDQADREQVELLRKDLAAAIGGPNAHLADKDLIDRLAAEGLLPSEAERRGTRNQREVSKGEVSSKASGPPLFPPSAANVPPAVPLLAEELKDARKHGSAKKKSTGKAVPSLPPQGAQHTAFVLRLGRNDAELRPGKPPDVFIPLAAYRFDLAFWGPLKHSVSPKGHEYDERYVEIEFRRQSSAVEHESRRLYISRTKHELRLSAAQVRADASPGDLLVAELAPPGLGVEYVVRVVGPSDPLYAKYDSVASNKVPNSEKRWGFV
jgi:hypothetical protein